ncbi:molybdopterin-synthase adenylyltransferase MoeB [Candidatus Sumerlaeota bacterium]|nr:molybdopterin-synthase adenylyltransferase MoeB [Candidatus Sumerlaeota bacterium]MBI3736354.1 molybdopterin-synthase adenylyltransferase MoeB [Candidatus Sumerlaeota bacterium]
MAGLDEKQVERYSRHILLPEVGGKGQQKLLNSSVLCIGAGGLGSPVVMYLAAAGVGRIGLIDGDVVDVSNLQRQIAHSTADIGRPKVESAKETAEGINPDVKVEAMRGLVTKENVMDLIGRYDAVIDGCDNFPTRFLVNDACYFLKKPLFSGAVLRFEGQVSDFLTSPEAPCYRCLYPEPPPPGMVPSCQEAGVLGVTVGTIGLIQATEFIKWVLGIGELLTGRLIIYDALGMDYRTVKLRKNPECPLCGPNPTITELVEYEEACEVRANR